MNSCSRPHMLSRLFAITLFLHATAFGQSFSSTVLADDHHSLELVSSDGSRLPAPMVQDQVGFDDPHVSPNGQYVGWLALYPNCCTSYPVPLQLVVMDSSQRLHTFTGVGQAIFRWCFLPDATSVAFMQTVLHGSNYEHFERRSLKTGRLLAQYDFPDDEAENKAARLHAPEWVRCVQDD